MLVSAAINRALRLLGVLDVAESPAAEDSQTAIQALNSMVQRWEANGLAVGWANVSAPDDTLPVPDEAQEAVIYNLAVRIAPEYGMPSQMQYIASEAARMLSELRRDRLVEMPLVQCSDLPKGLFGQWNITTDEPC
jgi:hypothetical protein